MSLASLCRAVRSMGVSAAQAVENMRAFEKALRDLPPMKTPTLYHYRCLTCDRPVQRGSTDPISPDKVFCWWCGGKCEPV